MADWKRVVSATFDLGNNIRCEIRPRTIIYTEKTHNARTYTDYYIYSLTGSGETYSYPTGSAIVEYGNESSGYEQQTEDVTWEEYLRVDSDYWFEMDSYGSSDIRRRKEIENRLVIPNGITKISEYMFSGISYYNLELPQSLIYVGECAFSPSYQDYDPSIWYGGRSFAQSLTIPKNLVNIGRRAFKNWKNLNTINFDKDYIIRTYNSDDTFGNEIYNPVNNIFYVDYNYGNQKTKINGGKNTKELYWWGYFNRDIGIEIPCNGVIKCFDKINNNIIEIPFYNKANHHNAILTNRDEYNTISPIKIRLSALDYKDDEGRTYKSEVHLKFARADSIVGQGIIKSPLFFSLDTDDLHISKTKYVVVYKTIGGNNG